MWQLKLTFVLGLALICIEAKPSHHFEHLDHHYDNHLNHFDHFEPLHQPLPDHVDYAAPLQLQEHLLPAPAPAPIWPAPAPLAPAAAWPAPAPLAPATLCPAPAPVWAGPPQFAPAPVLPPVQTHLLPTAELHLPTVTQVLPPVLEAVQFAPSYRAILGPKKTTHHVSIGYAFPKLLSAPHAHLRALPLKLAHHHHHHSLF